MNAYVLAMQVLDQGCIPVFVVDDEGELYFRCMYARTPAGVDRLCNPNSDFRAGVHIGLILATHKELIG